MKRTPLVLGLAVVSFLSFAQSKMDIGSQARLRDARSGLHVMSTSDGNAVVNKKPALTSEKLRGFVTLAREGGINDLNSIPGVEVVRRRGDLLLVEFDTSATDSLLASSAVAKFALERQLMPKMDRVREVSGIDMIHSGFGLPASYTGKGVVAGIVDGGFDPNHINFKKADGTSRISNFTYYRPTQAGGFVEEKYGADYIPNIDTEDETTFHGTHTLGIMAGGYRGTVDAAVKKNSFFGEVQQIDNPYYGVAYDADIAVACGALSDYYIALGVESILDYAVEQNKPSVINLSLGSNVGPHDGTSTICQYLDLVSEVDRVVFCISAGNEGDLPIALNKRFTADDTRLASFLYPAVYMKQFQNVRYGQTYVYSDSPEQFEIQAIIVNKSRNAVAFRMPLEATEGAMKYWVSSADYQGDDTDVIAPNFARYLTGYVGVGAEYDQNSGRYYAVIDCMCWDNTEGSNADGRYILGFQITGRNGQRVDVYGDGIYNNFSSYGLDGYDDGMTDGTISDVATGFNTVCVGSYNTRDDWASMDCGIYGYSNSFPLGEVSPFTSWGTLFDGRQFPLVCAPGATVISSSNKYYLDAENIGDEGKQAVFSDGERTYSWHQCVGTSMATPVVSGSIALWMEADPTLDYKTVKKIIQATAKVDDDVTNSIQWGAGKFDAYAGLKAVLAQSSIEDVAVSQADGILIRELGDKRVEIFDAGASAMAVSVFDMSGRCVASVNAPGNEAQVDLSAHAPGVYIVKVNNSNPKRVVIN